jgi:hypothetical protein
VTTQRLPEGPEPPQPSSYNADLARIARALEQLVRLADKALSVYFNARFPYGKPTDRWRRRGA